MDTITSVLAAIVIALVSGIVGNSLGARLSVRKESCAQMRSSCQALLIEKIDNLTKKVESLTIVVNGKILGL